MIKLLLKPYYKDMAKSIPAIQTDYPIRDIVVIHGVIVISKKYKNKTIFEHLGKRWVIKHDSFYNDNLDNVSRQMKFYSNELYLKGIQVDEKSQIFCEIVKEILNSHGIRYDVFHSSADNADFNITSSELRISFTKSYKSKLSINIRTPKTIINTTVLTKAIRLIENYAKNYTGEKS
jgi:hypothetical protein